MYLVIEIRQLKVRERSQLSSTLIPVIRYFMTSTYDLTFNHYHPMGWLRCSGDDTASFLQGQFTNELRGLVPRQSAYGLWLDQKGKVLADSFILRGDLENEFWVGSVFSPAATIRERLEAYVIADDVVIEDLTAVWTGFTLIGDGARKWLEERHRQGFWFPGRRTRSENMEWVLPRTHAAEAKSLLLAAGAREVSTREIESQRIAAGIPAVPQDIGPGELPQEGGLDEDAISFTKGCYLGQEVMARLKSMGRVRRRLMRVNGYGNHPAVLPAPLFLGARHVGELRSAVPDASGGFAGLALLSLIHVTAESTLAFGPEQEPTVRLAAAP